MTPLPKAFLERPIAHRALHDISDARPENSLAAIRAAIKEGYGIEIDVQLSADHQAVVFHDDDLDRLTDYAGPIRQRTAAELSRIQLQSGSETIPTLFDALRLVGGHVPLLIEIKDQNGALGPEVGALEQAVADALKDYGGLVAVMSFNPHSVTAFGRAAPNVPRGLVTSPFREHHWPNVPADRRAELAAIPHLETSGAGFISHQGDDLTSPIIARIKSKGFPILCWTVRSPEEEALARTIADNVTFEGYLA